MWITNEETGVSIYIIDHFSLIKPEVPDKTKEEAFKKMSEFASKFNLDYFSNKEKATV